MSTPGLISNTIKLLISKLIPALLLTLINILFSRNLSFDDYGIYQTAWSIVNVSVIVVTFGVPRYVLSFGSVWQYDKRLLLKIIATAFIITLIPIGYYLFLHTTGMNKMSIVILLLIILSQGIYLIQEANVIAIVQNSILIKVNLVYACLLFAVHILILWGPGYNLSLCLLGILVISLIRNAILYSSQLKYRSKHVIKKAFDKIELFWFGINDTLQIITKWLDKIILLWILTSADYAVYFNGTYEIPLIGMILSAFQAAVTTNAAINNDQTKQLQLFKRSTTMMASLLFPLFALCFIFSDEIITLLFSDNYSGSAQLFAITSVLLPLRIASYTVMLQLKKKGKTILIGSVIDFIVAITLMIVLYPVYGLPGLAISLVIATYVQAGYYTFHIARTYKCTLNELFEVRYLAILLFISIALLSASKYLIPLSNSLINMSIGIVASLTIVIVSFQIKIGFKEILKK